MGVFDHPEFDRHESIHCFDEPTTGLRAIVAIHSTALGPAAGGCRRWRYASDTDALTDVLRLSRGMTYKNAIAGLPFGGGKAVILAAERSPKSAELFAAFGRAVDSLGGHYITAEDVGIGVEDMLAVRRETRFVSGLPQACNDAGGDPSPWTAYGVFLGIQVAVEARLGIDSLEGLRIAVQGVGHVGRHLCRLLHDAGARLVIADVDPAKLRTVGDELPVTETAPSEVLFSDVDVVAPCALGGVLTAATIPRLRAKVVAGAANNQLATADDGRRLAERDILYAPDYVVNAGGIISVAREYLGESSTAAVRADVGRIAARLRGIFDDAAVTARPTNVVADELAHRLVASASENKRLTNAAAGPRIA